MVPVNLVHGSMLQTNQQQYPIQKPEEQDVLKFKLELEPSGQVPPIFEAIDKVDKVKEADNTVFGLLKNVDSNYHHVLTSMSDLARDEKKLEFKSLSAARNEVEAVRTQSSGDVQGDAFVRTPEDVQNENQAGYKELIANQEENQLKAMQMIHDMTNKTIGAQMFMSNIKVIGAAISQLSQGFKTLFRSSG